MSERKELPSYKGEQKRKIQKLLQDGTLRRLSYRVFNRYQVKYQLIDIIATPRPCMTFY